MELVTADEMRALDEATIRNDGIASSVLMSRAGYGVAEAVKQLFPKAVNIVCLAGKGNNGGDARIAAEQLSHWGYSCQICTSLDLPLLESADVIIDGLLGTGVRSPLTTDLENLIQHVNQIKKPVVAIDIPSGLDATTGRSCGAVIHASATVTMGLPKLGFYINAGPENVGKIVCVDIGIRPKRVRTMQIKSHVTTEQDVLSQLPKRERSTHKGSFGHVVVIGGSRGKMGAGILASRGVLRSGAGLVTYALPESAFEKFDTTLPEIMIEPLPDNGTGILHTAALSKIDKLMSNKSAIVLGPGIGTAEETTKVVHHLLQNKLPIVIDADALNCIAEKSDCLKLLQTNAVLTPHPGEMARLVHKNSANVQQDRVSVARQFAKTHPATLVLKGSSTITAYHDEIWINPTGNPGMATAGMGDVLAGIIAGFLAQGLSSFEAARIAVFLHGLAGDRVSLIKGEQGILASDVADALPEAIHVVQANQINIIPTIRPHI